MTEQSRRLCVALALLGGACGSRAVPQTKPDGGGDAAGDASDGAASTSHPDFTSGTRLRARSWTAGGETLGVDTLAGPLDQIWYDQQLGVPCTFVTSDRGVWCEPVPSFLDPARASFPVIGFAEAACGGDRVISGPIGGPRGAWRDAYCAGKRYARLLERQEGLIVVSTYEVGAALSGTSWYMQPLDLPDECSAVDVVQPSDFRRVARKATVADFVSARREKIPSGRRLSPIMIVADDGARQRVAWHDEELNVGCNVAPSGDGKMRCLPTAGGALVLPGFFAEGCKLILAVPTTEGVKEGDLVKAAQTAPGISLDAYYRLGAAAKKIYEIAADGACVESIFFTGAYPLIDELPVSRMDEFTSTSRDVNGLRATTLVDAEGTVDRSTFTLTDVSTGVRCMLAPTSDGRTRCLPDTTVNLRYADATCPAASPVVSNAPGAPAPTHAMRWKGDVCSGGFDVVAVGAAIPSPEKTYDTDPYGSGCVLNPFATPGILSYHSVGQPLPLDAFPAVELVTE